MSGEINKNQFLISSGSEFFTLLEKKLKVKIPIYVKNVLKISGFDNVLIMSKMKDESILQMEHFMQNEFIDIMIEERQSIDDYYGIYKNARNNFKFLCGHKLLLKTLSKFCKEQLKSTNEESSSSSADNVTTNTNMPNEQKKLFKILFEWMKSQKSLAQVFETRQVLIEWIDFERFHKNIFCFGSYIKFLENTTQRKTRCLPKIQNVPRYENIFIKSHKIGPLYF